MGCVADGMPRSLRGSRQRTAGRSKLLARNLFVRRVPLPRRDLEAGAIERIRHTARTEWPNGLGKGKGYIRTRIALLYECAKRGGAGSLKAGWVQGSVNRTGLHEL